MTAREPFKPISVHKKWGEIYFEEKCHLNGFEPAPNVNSFTEETAETMVRKYKDAKKPVKIKITGLADSLKLAKGSRLGKKIPYSRVKYSEVKFHKVFPQAKNVLVIGVQGSDNLKKYMVITFERPIEAANLDDQLKYSKQAPKNNLKNRIPVVDTPSVRQPTPEYENPTLSPAPSEPNRQLSRNSVTEKNGGIVLVEEIGLPRSNFDMSPQFSVDAPSYQLVGLPRQTAHSSNPTFTPSPTPHPMTPRSSTHTALSKVSNHSGPETVIELANRQQVAPICSKCRSVCEETIDIAISPIKIPDKNQTTDYITTKSSPSSTRPQSQSKIFTQNTNLSRSFSHSQDRTPNGNLRNRKRSESMTSTSSHHTLATDASSHYILEGERELFEHWTSTKEQQMIQQQPEENNYLINRDTIIVVDNTPAPEIKPQRTRSNSSSRPVKHKKSKSRREHRPIPMNSTKSSPVRDYNSSVKSNENNEALFILATGKFKPFSEFSHEHTANTHGICSICGKEGEGYPRQIEIIRTGSSGGPVISEDGCVYMYSTTRPVEYSNGSGTHQKKNSSRKHRTRLSSSSSSSSSSSTRGESQMEAAPTSSYHSSSLPPHAQTAENYVQRRNRSHSKGKKKSYRNSFPGSTSMSNRTRSEPRIFMSSVPVYQSNTLPASRIMKMNSPVEISRNRSLNNKKGHHKGSKRKSVDNFISEADILRPVVPVIYQEVPLSSELYITQKPRAHRKSSRQRSTKKKIYRMESSDSGSSSSSTEERVPNRASNMKVIPILY